jgi:hypothetical protein
MGNQFENSNEFPMMVDYDLSMFITGFSMKE